MSSKTSIPNNEEYTYNRYQKIPRESFFLHRKKSTGLPRAPGFLENVISEFVKVHNL